MSGKAKKKLVIVESPAKAKTISRFLGPEYKVDFCLGHVRDLPSSARQVPKNRKGKSASSLGVDIDNQFAPLYVIPEDKKKVIQNLKSQLAKSGELILATDEDREGESISWHLKEVLAPKVPVKRMVFHEITKKAIESSLKHFRKINERLVNAQEARRILDRLVGYKISPFLWKNVMRGLSAGRVQSVAVSMVSERELERLSFEKQMYWSLTAEHPTPPGGFVSRLVSHRGQKVITGSHFDSTTGKLLPSREKLLWLKEKEVVRLAEELKSKTFLVDKVQKKQISKKPPAPFITSTLQQESNRKLRMSSRETMRVAQRLYEQGWITYTRTDSTFLSSEALSSARLVIKKLYGSSYLPSSPRVYQSQVKGAQEAHEAIRPAGGKFIEPHKTGLKGPALTVYELIWKRTLASQMKNCLQNQVRFDLKVSDSLFVSSGVRVEFPGFYLIYRDQDTQEVRLPDLKAGDRLSCQKLQPTQHETKAPARFTEASLVQKLEKEGVGRPSTYASIIGTIQERGYVRKEKNTLIPTFAALVVTRLLKKHFPDYVDTHFTSKMEKDLDDIAEGKKKKESYLKSVYSGPKGLQKQVLDSAKVVMDRDFKTLKLKGFEGYSFHVGPFGAYVSKKQGKKEVSASLPRDMYPGELDSEKVEQLIQNKLHPGRLLGRDPQTGEDVFLQIGRYGPYVQRGRHTDKKTAKSKGKKKSPSSTKKGKKSASSQKPPVKKVSIRPFFTEQSITLKGALQLLDLPQSIGTHPQTKKEIKKGLGRFGPYIVCDGEFRSVPVEGFFSYDLKSAIELLNQPKKSRRSVLKSFKHPTSGGFIELMKGRFGPYLKYRKKNYSLPRDFSSDTVVDVKQVLSLMEEAGDTGDKGGKAPGRRGKTPVREGKTPYRGGKKGNKPLGRRGKAPGREGKALPVRGDRTPPGKKGKKPVAKGAKPRAERAKPRAKGLKKPARGAKKRPSSGTGVRVGAGKKPSHPPAKRPSNLRRRRKG